MSRFIEDGKHEVTKRRTESSITYEIQTSPISTGNQHPFITTQKEGTASVTGGKSRTPVSSPGMPPQIILPPPVTELNVNSAWGEFRFVHQSVNIEQINMGCCF